MEEGALGAERSMNLVRDLGNLIKSI